MSLSYSAITNHGKATLGSVESWGTNMSILKDPPKSLYTRRINKVGQTSDITATIDEASDRACEAILQYARGVNPMVSVSYNNSNSQNGNNTSAGNSQAFLPYRINREGAFRPPIQTEYNLLPLSRMPRVWTSSFSNPSFPDFSRQLNLQGNAETTKEVKNFLLKTSARPTAVYKIETPLEKPYEVKYSVKDSINTSAHSRIKTTDRTTQNVLEPTKEINKNLQHAFAHSNKQDIRHIDNKELNTDRYLQDTNAHAVNTIKGADYLQNGNLDEQIDMGDVKVRNAVNIEYETPLHGNEKTDYIHGDLFQERNLPYYTAESNIRGDKTNVSYIHDDLDLNRALPYHESKSNMRGDKNTVSYIHDNIELDRTLPYHSADSNISGDKKISYIHDDISLYRNIPGYTIDSTMRGNEKVSYIHDDIELQRVLPEYQANTTKTQNNLQKRINPEYIKELTGSVPSIKDVYMNKAGQGESNISSRTKQLADKIQPGSYHIPGNIPSQNRANNIKENFQTDKSRMDKKVIDQHMNRFGSVAPFDKKFR